MGKKEIILAAATSFLLALITSVGFCFAAGAPMEWHDYAVGQELDISTETVEWTKVAMQLQNGVSSYSNSPYWAKVRVGDAFTTTVMFPMVLSSTETAIEVKGLENYSSAKVKYILPMAAGGDVKYGTWETGALALLPGNDALQSVSDLISYGVSTQHIAATPRPRQVSFNANGGTGTMNAQTLNAGDSITLTNAFTRVSGEFLGWNTKADGSGTSYANNATLNYADLSSDITLYAQWRVTTFLDTGENFNLKIRSLMTPSLINRLGDSTVWDEWRVSTAENITSIQFVKTLPSGVDANTRVNVATSGAIPVYAYLGGTDIYIVSEANHLVANGDSSRMFYGLINLATVNSLDSILAVLDTSNVTDMSEMFFYLNFLNADSSQRYQPFTIPASFDTSNVIDMSRMFYGFGRLTINENNLCVSISLPASFDTSNVTDMSEMFYWVYSYELILPQNFKAVGGVDITNIFELGWVMGSFGTDDSRLRSEWYNSEHEMQAIQI